MRKITEIFKDTKIGICQNINELWKGDITMAPCFFLFRSLFLKRINLC